MERGEVTRRVPKNLEAQHSIAHVLEDAAQLLVLEGINLAQVPAGECSWFCAPLRILDFSGSPVRAALLDRALVSTRHSQES